MARRKWLLVILACVLLGAGLLLPSLGYSVAGLRSLALSLFPGQVAEQLLLWPRFDEDTPRAQRVQVRLRAVARGLTQPTALAFLPSGALLVAEQAGTFQLLRDGEPHEWLKVDDELVSGGELGLLGVALSPHFVRDGRLFVSYTRKGERRPMSVVAEYRTETPAAPIPETPRFVSEILTLEQPYPNHNGGCVLFGPDEKLYIGFGDGGSAGDPQKHAQDPREWLGSVLRIDVSDTNTALPYAVPSDNPFVGRLDFAPETFAFGVRNPWRLSFAVDGGLIVADVGQNRFEEISVARAGDNLGWNIMEGRACYPREPCDKHGLKPPFFVYEHPLGGSITGGEVVLDTKSPLVGSYVFGDYVSGRLWAIALPSDDVSEQVPRSLGRWPILPSTFGRDAAGRLYVADHRAGAIYRIEP